MSGVETVALGRSKRSTAGNRMRELLEKAHQENDDELFREEADDEEFRAPQDQRDVYLEDFADTDDEVEMDEEAEERALRREERRKAKGKAKAYDPFAPSKPKLKVDPTRSSGPSTPTLAERLVELDPTMDPATMAPSALVLTLRRKQREQKRLGRSEAIRSTLRTSTLKTEEKIIEKEKEAQAQPHRKGRKALHEGGEVRGSRPMTQDELIAAALEEEERNREALRDWVRREEERRELRRVGRKRVRGPRWTFISRTVGSLVEEVEPAQDIKGPGSKRQKSLSKATTAEPASQPAPPPNIRTIQLPDPSEARSTPPPVERSDSLNPFTANVPMEPSPAPDIGSSTHTPQSSVIPQQTPADSSSFDIPSASTLPQTDSKVEQPATVTLLHKPPRSSAPEALPLQSTPQQYARNYIILSQIPGGISEELAIVLGDHVEWKDVKYIPHRGRPINRRPTISPFSGKTAKYRHPGTNILYSNIEEFKQIQALLDHRFVWSEELGVWLGGEEDVPADGAADIPGWREAVHGGWLGGKDLAEMAQEIDEGAEEPEVVVEMDEDVVLEEPAGRGKRRKRDSATPIKSKQAKSSKGKAVKGKKKTGKVA